MLRASIPGFKYSAITIGLKNRDASILIFGAIAILLCIAVALPIAWLIWYGFTDAQGHPTFENIALLVSDRTMLVPLLTSLYTALASAFAACVVALPLAWLVARTDVPLAGTIRALVMASFVTPPFLGAIAWELLAAPNSGILNQWARAIFGLGEYDFIFDIYSVSGLIFTIACYTFPYVFVLVANALERIPADLEDASAILGGGRWHTHRRIIFPLIMPALLAGGLIAFLHGLTLFGSPAILALPAGFHTLTTKIASLFQYPPHLNLAAAASFPLLLITAVVLQLQSWLLGKRSFVVVGGKNNPPAKIALGAWKAPALLLAAIILMNPIFLPYAALLKAALIRNLSDPISSQTFTLEHIRFALFEYSGTGLAIFNTTILAVAAATTVTAIGLVISYVASRKLVRGHQFLSLFAMAPIAVPGIVMGVGLFLVYSNPPFLLYGTLWILFIAFATMEIPASFQQINAALKILHVELEEAARILGASQIKALWQITRPILRTTILATWCFVFIGVIRELSASILLTTSNTKTVAVVIYDLNQSGNIGAISVLGLLVLMITFLVVFTVNNIPVLGRH